MIPGLGKFIFALSSTSTHVWDFARNYYRIIGNTVQKRPGFNPELLKNLFPADYHDILPFLPCLTGEKAPRLYQPQRLFRC